jgi:TATA-binding protein-associated factor
MNQELARSGRNLADISLAPKLLAVRQLLWDCGIGRTDEDDGAEDPDASSRHRVLIFAQMKVLTLAVC